MKRLLGKIFIVTGGSSGIGRAAVTRLAQEGAHVSVLDLTGFDVPNPGANESGDSEILSIVGDVSLEDTIDRAFAATLDRFGRIDGIVNNAAIMGPMGPLRTVDVSSFDQTLHVNARGVFLGTRAAMRQFETAGTSGTIVNVAALAGITGFRNLAAYVAAKHAVIGLTRVAAAEGAKDGVRCNAVCPGMIENPHLRAALEALDPGSYEIAQSGQASGRAGRPVEVGDLIVWLLSDEASYVNGSIISVDGGTSSCIF